MKNLLELSYRNNQFTQIELALKQYLKKYPDKVIAVSGIVFGHVPCAIIAVMFFPAPSIESVPYIIGSAFIHQGYQWFLLSVFFLATAGDGKFLGLFGLIIAFL